VSVRDDAERVVRAWHGHEVARGARPVVDYDCAPPPPGTERVAPARSRLDVLERLTELRDAAIEGGDDVLAPALDAHVAYLGHVLGERPPLAEYLRRTQGCEPEYRDHAYCLAVELRARLALEGVGVAWGPAAMTDLDAADGPLELHEARARVEAVARELEPAIRALADTDAPYQVTIEVVDVDDYWAYWLDGAGSRVRLRFNLRHARFSESRLRQFAVHELLGHALQSASYARQAATSEVPWLRLLSTNLPYQVCLEGLASALPLFIAPDDAKLVARVRVDHHLQLVRAEIHEGVAAGIPLPEIARRAAGRVPWWGTDRIADELADRGTDPMLRSYLWSYCEGTDWFVNLADHAEGATIQNVFRAAYRSPQTPADLRAAWPGGRR
jgi:hypothetical protein